ncbi:hypothetical protein [Streptomyces sp. DSM 118878]
MAGKVHARQVFSDYDRMMARADRDMDDALARRAQTEVLLKETLAGYRVHRKADTPGSSRY